MKNIEYLCPTCGSNVLFLIDNICYDCYSEKVILFDIPNVLNIMVCECCNSFYHKNKWIKYNTLEIALQYFIKEQVKINRKIKNIDIIINIFKYVSPYIYQLSIEGKLCYNSHIINKQKIVEVRIKRTSCTICSRKSGGYFEATLQLRSEAKESFKKEINLINDFILDSIKKYQADGDSNSFISNLYESKDGIDYQIGSMNIARKISKSLARIFCCITKESYTLVGVKDGKKTYRITIVIKLPIFRVGDIFYFENNVVVIKNIYNKMKVMNLKTLFTWSIDITQFKGGIYLGNKVDNVKQSLIISIEKNTLLILDTNNFETFQIEKPNLFDFKAGDSINIFKCEYGNFIII